MADEKIQKYRIFNILQYENNPKTGASLKFDETNIISALKHKTIQRYAYIKHDKDTVTEYDVENDNSHWSEADLGKKKGVHWHVVIECPKSPQELKTIATWFDVPENQIQIPKGKGAFIDCVEYLRHSDIHQELLGKYEYDADEVKSNFDWQAEVEKVVLRKTKYEKPLSESQYVKNEILYNGLTLQEVYEKYPTLYQQELTIISKLRSEYLSRFAPMPAYRINYYIEGQSGYGKDTMAYSIARSLYPELGDEAYFEIGANRVSFDGYDGEPVIIWSEFRAETFLDTFDGYEQVLSTLDVIPKAKKREHKKYGSLRLTNSVNIVTSTQPYNSFLSELVRADIHDKDHIQANRRFPIIIPIHQNDFDIMINSGYLDAGERNYSDYKTFRNIQSSFGKLAQRLSTRPKVLIEATKEITKPIIEAHDVVTDNMHTEHYDGMTDDEVLQALRDEGLIGDSVIKTADDIWEEEFDKFIEEQTEEFIQFKSYEIFREEWVMAFAEELVGGHKKYNQIANYDEWKALGCNNYYNIKTKSFEKHDIKYDSDSHCWIRIDEV